MFLQSFVSSNLSKYLKQRKENLVTIKENTERMLQAENQEEKEKLKEEYQRLIDDLKLLEELAV